MQIDVAPPTIQSVTNASGVAYDATHPASSLDVVNVYVSNLDPGVLTNPSRLQVTLNGQSMPVQSVTPAANGQVQIQFVLNQSFGGVAGESGRRGGWLEQRAASAHRPVDSIPRQVRDTVTA